MYHHLCYHSIIILILLNICCYSSPIPYADQNEQDQIPLSVQMDEEQHLMKAHKNDQLYNYNILCVLYNDCYNKDHEDIIYTDLKTKRLASNLFHGIPKFGKRAFVSAFSGIPKFG